MTQEDLLVVLSVKTVSEDGGNLESALALIDRLESELLITNARRAGMKYGGGRATSQVKIVFHTASRTCRWYPLKVLRQHTCDDCGRELCVFMGTQLIWKSISGIDPVEGRKLDLYMDIVNRMLAGTFEATGYIQKSVESWQRRETELKNIDRPKRQ